MHRRLLLTRIVTLLTLLTSRCAAQDGQTVEYVYEEEAVLEGPLGNLVQDTDMLGGTVGFQDARNLEFRVVSKPEHLDFDYISIARNTGDVIMTRPIDRDVICPKREECVLQYGVVVSPGEFFRVIKVMIRILDENDNTPTFAQPEVTIYIPESTAPGTYFPVPPAEDLDAGSFGIQQHTLVTSERGVFRMKVEAVAGGHFDIRLQLESPLDRETRDHYECDVIARDGGEPAKEGRLRINIVVNDSNDNAPRFLRPEYNVSVGEDTPRGSSIVRVRAEDDDAGANGRIRYSFSLQTRDDYGRKFGINAQTGDVYVSERLDYEEQRVFVLTVDAHDQGPGTLTSQTTVVVHVTDVNDHPPEVSINTLDPSGVPRIGEGERPQTFVAHLQVTDRDLGEGGIFRCEIRSDDFDLIKIAVDQYNIVSRRTFDREVTSHFRFPIICVDNGSPPLTSIQDMNIEVTDKNDNPPIFSRSPYTIDVVENMPLGSVVTHINATDADAGANARIRYSLSGDVSDVLHIDPETGVITTLRALDHESSDQHLNFNVFAEDRGRPPLTASVDVRVTVLDEDDELPVFERAQYEFRVPEGEQPGVRVGRVLAHDADSYPYDAFLYSLDRFDGVTELFTINPNSGHITTRAMLDREVRATHRLKAHATSIADPHDRSSCDVIVYVDDKNDNKPHFRFPIINRNNTVSLYSQAPAGQTVAELRAYDADAGNNADLMYAIVAGNDDNTFSLDSSSGKLFLFKDISTVAARKYRLTVEVKDKGDPQLSAVSTLYVQVVNSTVDPVAVADASSWLQSQSLTVFLAVAAGAVLLLIFVAVVVVIFCHRHKRDRLHARHADKTALNGDTKECEKMLQLTPLPPSNGVVTSVGKDCHGNGVTLIDMRSETLKSCRHPLEKGSAEEQVPLTVDLLSDHPVVKVRLWTVDSSSVSGLNVL